MKKKEPTLHEMIWACAKKYAQRVGEIIERKPEYWVAEELSISTCCFGDVYFLDLDEMMIIVDHLDKWIKNYGSQEKVGETVIDWFEWCLEDAVDPATGEWRNHNRINLNSWLMGLRPEQLKR